MKKTGPLLIPLVSWLMPYGNRVENGKKKWRKNRLCAGEVAGMA